MPVDGAVDASGPVKQCVGAAFVDPQLLLHAERCVQAWQDNRVGLQETAAQQESKDWAHQLHRLPG
jgi:hypothetical protein